MLAVKLAVNLHSYSWGPFFCIKQIDKMPEDTYRAQIWHHLRLRTDYSSHIYVNLYLYVLPLLLIIGQISLKPCLSFTVSISYYHTPPHLHTSVTCRHISWHGGSNFLSLTLITVVSPLPRHSPVTDRIMAFSSSLVCR